MLCATAGLSMAGTPLDGGATAHQVVRDYSARTFSRADAPEPPEPQANCCARIAGPGMGLVELPDRSMRWSPVPHRGGGGIAAWTGMWLCLRCQHELLCLNA